MSSGNFTLAAVDDSEESDDDDSIAPLWSPFSCTDEKYTEEYDPNSDPSVLQDEDDISETDMDVQDLVVSCNAFANGHINQLTRFLHAGLTATHHLVVTERSNFRHFFHYLG